MGSTKAPTSHEEEIEEEHNESDETTTESSAQEDSEETQHHEETSDDDSHTEAVEADDHLSHEEEEVPVEQRLRQLTDDLGRLDKISSNDDENRQSFLSLSDLIKTLRPNDERPLQIDSSYSRSQVLGENLKPDIVYHPRNAATGDAANRSLFKKK